MKVLVFVKATPNSEKGILPNDEQMTRMFAEMGKFNEQLIKAGIMTEADGLKPSSAGKRLKFSDHGAPTVIDGPFAETKELVAGYWIWNVKSMDEAVEWARKCPNPMPGEEGVLEIRPTYAAEEFEALLPEELRAQEERLRKEVARQQKAKAKPKPKPKVKSASKAKASPARKQAASKQKARRPARAKSKK
jgi:hypothetical protein